METKVNIDGKEYKIDLEQAKNLGIIKEVNTTDVQSGDLFYSPSWGNMLIVQLALDGQYFFLGGHSNKALPWEHSYMMTRTEMVEWLNRGDRVWVGNITDKVEELITTYYPTK